MGTLSDAEEFRGRNAELVELANVELQGFFQSLDVLGDPELIRDALLDFVPDLVQTYGDTAAVLAADYYDMLRDASPSATAFRALLAEPVDFDQAAASTRWAIDPLFQAEPDTVAAMSLLSDSVQRLILQPGRDTVMESAWADSVRMGVARIPSGTDTCEFCIKLASRGPVYKNEISATMVVGRGSTRTGYDKNGKRLPGGIGGGIKPRGKRDIGQTFHDGCDCTTLLISSEQDWPEGYDPDKYYDMYMAGQGTGRYGTDS